MKYISNYKDIKKFKPIKLRGIIRNAVLTGITFKNRFIDYDTFYEKPKVQFIYLHHIFDDEVKQLERLLNWLKRYYTFISYSEAVTRILNNKIDKPYVCFSFDDGFKNNIKAAAVLERYNTTGCFFINPDVIGQKDFYKIKKYCNSVLNFPPIEFLDWNDVNNLLKSGHEIGSHTIGHINIANKNEYEIEDNLIKSFEMIKRECGTVKHFAFPYGRFFHFNKLAYHLVFKTGYKTCASAERGCHITDKIIKEDELMIRRDHIICAWPLDHIKYFLLKSSMNCSQDNNYVPY
jgi:hypothetical protein